MKAGGIVVLVLQIGGDTGLAHVQQLTQTPLKGGANGQACQSSSSMPE